jgi:sirohydrochlorin cobaltochelatase
MTARGPRGILLLAHGSRDARWREPVEAVALQVAARDPDALVACAYLELADPDLPAAAAMLVERGARSVRVVPLFLGIGKHLREDLPGLLERLRASHEGVTFTLRKAIGEETQVIDLLAKIATSDG